VLGPEPVFPEPAPVQHIVKRVAECSELPAAVKGTGCYSHLTK